MVRGPDNRFHRKAPGNSLYRLEKYIFPVIGKEHIARMEPQDILKVIQPIEQKGQNETAGACCKSSARSTAMP